MKLRDYAEDKAVTLCFLAMGMVIFGAAAMILKIPSAACFLFFGFFAVYTVIWLCAGFVMERKRLMELERMIERLPEKWLLGEVCFKPRTWTQKEYDRIMHTVSSAAIEALERERREKEAYYDYVESWIHEMKTPLIQNKAKRLIIGTDGKISLYRYADPRRYQQLHLRFYRTVHDFRGRNIPYDCTFFGTAQPCIKKNLLRQIIRPFQFPAKLSRGSA